jgi:type VI secretion system protein ImpH
MAGPLGSTPSSVNQRLAEEPYRFDFFQAVRLLELEAALRCASGSSLPHRPIGNDYPPAEENIRFRVAPSRQFPASAIESLRTAYENNHGDAEPAEMTVSFMGMIGPSGVLPQHYTQLVIDRTRQNDRALRDFLDLFHHRQISHFYRAWEKNRIAFSLERSARRDDAPEALFTFALHCLSGIGFSKLRGRLRLADESLVYYGGHFSHGRPQAVNLQQLVEDYFGISTEVIQFFGQWLYLSPERDQSLLATPDCPLGRNTQLGVNVVVGERLWNAPSKFRLRIGPLRYADFRRFVPGTEGLSQLCQIVRTYTGLEFDFDVQLCLVAEDVPWCQLDEKSEDPARLGWNTWIRSSPFEEDVDDAVFCDEGMPAVAG